MTFLCSKSRCLNVVVNMEFSVVNMAFSVANALLTVVRFLLQKCNFVCTFAPKKTSWCWALLRANFMYKIAPLPTKLMEIMGLLLSGLGEG